MRKTFAALIFAGGIALSCLAQAPTGGGGGTGHANQLPLSNTGGSGSVTVQQSAASGNATITSSIGINGSYSGSVVSSEPLSPGPIRLTLADAVKRGLAANLGPISANNAARAARDQRLQVLSALLPNIAISASDTITQVNLAAYGFQFKTPANFGFSIPTVVGPYNYSQLQGTLNQSVFDLVQRRNLQSARASEKSSILAAKDAHDVVVLAIAGTYFQTLATAERIVSQRAQVDSAQAVFNQAQIRKTAGVNARIDVTRSQVEFETERQRLTSLEADYRKQLIALARLLGLPQDREIHLEDRLNTSTPVVPEPAQAVQEALSQRADLQSVTAQVQAARKALNAAKAERYPAASISGDYGVIGPNPTSAHGVFAVTGSINVPVWQGGRISADIDQAQTTLNQREAELADQRGRVEQGVRDALIELETADGQVNTAARNKTLANDTLAQARDRFAAGVATTLEVVQAQQQVAGAENDYIASLFSLNLARLSLAREMGNTEKGIGDTSHE